MTYKQQLRKNFGQNSWSHYKLDEKDYEIFLAMQQDPTINGRALGKQLGLDPQTVRNRITGLKERGFFRQNEEIDDPILGARQLSEASAVYQPKMLDLIRQNVIFQDIESMSKLKILELLCDLHPYTHYKCIVYGAGRSLFAQFDLPSQVSQDMEELYQFAVSNKLCSSYIIMDTVAIAESNVNLYQWQLDNNRWKIIDSNIMKSMGNRPSRIEFLWQLFLDEEKKEPLVLSLPDTSFKFDELDLKLIRELTINSNVTNQFLGNSHNKDRSTISKRMKKIREQVIAADYLHYDTRIFDLSYSQLITGKFRKGDDLELSSFFSFLKSGHLPFRTVGIMDYEQFFWYMNIPPSFAPEFTEFILGHADEVHINQVNLSTASTYYFNSGNYAGKGKWKTEKDYVVTSLQNSIENIMKKVQI